MGYRRRMSDILFSDEESKKLQKEIESGFFLAEVEMICNLIKPELTEIIVYSLSHNMSYDKIVNKPENMKLSEKLYGYNRQDFYQYRSYVLAMLHYYNMGKGATICNACNYDKKYHERNGETGNYSNQFVRCIHERIEQRGR